MPRPLRMLAASALLGLAACGGSTPETVEAPGEAPAGERLTLAPSAIPDSAEVPATITTRDMAEARARIPGILARLLVREGDRVAAGQRIGTVTDSRLAEETAALGAAAAAAEAEAARAGAELERVRFLHGEGVYAKARLESALAAARAAEAQVRAARAQQAAVAAVAGQGSILAPASGRVLRADIPEGSVVSPGMTVAVITAGPPVVRLDLPESLGSRVAPGAAVTVSGVAGLPADRTLEGRVTMRYPGVTAGRVTLDAAVDGLDPALVGQRVTARVDLGERRALAVPARFVSRRYGLSFATLLAPDGSGARDIPVEVRPIAGTDRVEILSGLRAGDTIIAPAGGRA